MDGRKLRVSNIVYERRGANRLELMSGAEPKFKEKKFAYQLTTSFHHKSIGSSFKEKWNVDKADSSKFDCSAENTADKALSNFWMDDGIEQSAFLQNTTKLFGKT